MAFIFYGICIYFLAFDSVAVFVLEIHGIESLSMPPKFKIKLQGFFYLVSVLLQLYSADSSNSRMLNTY